MHQRIRTEKFIRELSMLLRLLHMAQTWLEECHPRRLVRHISVFLSSAVLERFVITICHRLPTAYTQAVLLIV